VQIRTLIRERCRRPAPPLCLVLDEGPGRDGWDMLISERLSSLSVVESRSLVLVSDLACLGRESSPRLLVYIEPDKVEGLVALGARRMDVGLESEFARLQANHLWEGSGEGSGQ
jgi:hypothetical protein